MRDSTSSGANLCDSDMIVTVGRLRSGKTSIGSLESEKIFKFRRIRERAIIFFLFSNDNLII